jgi:hypothetical protein
VRRLAVVAVFLIIAVVAAPAAVAQTPPVGPTPISLLVVALPAEEARVLIAEHAGAFGAGVYPDSRDAAAFWREVSAGAPRRRQGVRSPLAGRQCLLGRALSEQRKGVNPESLAGAPVVAEAALKAIFCGSNSANAPAPAPAAIAAPSAESAGPLVARASSVIVLGIAPRTPIVLGLIGEGHGVIDGGIARRPGVVTPYDLTATILQRSGTAAPSSGIIGRVLRVEQKQNPLPYVAGLARRFERDASFGPAVAGATIAVLLGGGVVLTILLLLLGAHPLALRTARGGAAGVSGYVASLFVPTGNALLRSIPIVVAFLIGALVPLGDAPRTRLQIGRLLGLAAAAIAVLAVAAALNPGGEPALSLWGDPLVSWRLFGLRNHLSSMMQLGVFAGVAAGMRSPSPVAAASAGVAGAFVAGAAFLGANFVAVFTLAFGAALTVAILVRSRVTLSAAAAAAGIAIVAFGVALLADAGSPASHGGQAVQRVRAGGLHAAWDFLIIRWRLSIREIGSLWGGWAWTALLVAGLSLILWRALRDAAIPAGVRAVLFGGSAAALAALAMEDTGFLAGGIIALAPGLVAATAIVERVTRSPDGAG